MRHPALLLFLLLHKNILAQKMVFNMSAFGIPFGRLEVTKIKEDDSTDLYTLHAKGYLKVLWMERSDETVQQVRYRNGVLLSSEYKQMESGEVKKWTTIRLENKQYLVRSYRGSRTFSDAPVRSTITLYFDPHHAPQRVFYEAEATDAQLSKRDANTLEVKTSDGNRSLYRFRNGELHEMEFQISIATVRAVRAI